MRISPIALLRPAIGPGLFACIKYNASAAAGEQFCAVVPRLFFDGLCWVSPKLCLRHERRDDMLGGFGEKGFFLAAAWGEQRLFIWATPIAFAGGSSDPAGLFGGFTAAVY